MAVSLSKFRSFIRHEVGSKDCRGNTLLSFKSTNYKQSEIYFEKNKEHLSNDKLEGVVTSFKATDNGNKLFDLLKIIYSTDISDESRSNPTYAKNLNTVHKAMESIHDIYIANKRPDNEITTEQKTLIRDVFYEKAIQVKYERRKNSKDEKLNTLLKSIFEPEHKKIQDIHTSQYKTRKTNTEEVNKVISILPQDIIDISLLSIQLEKTKKLQQIVKAKKLILRNYELQLLRQGYDTKEIQKQLLTVATSGLWQKADIITSIDQIKLQLRNNQQELQNIIKATSNLIENIKELVKLNNIPFNNLLENSESLNSDIEESRKQLGLIEQANSTSEKNFLGNHQNYITLSKIWEIESIESLCIEFLEEFNKLLDSAKTITTIADKDKWCTETVLLKNELLAKINNNYKDFTLEIADLIYAILIKVDTSNTFIKQHNELKAEIERNSTILEKLILSNISVNELPKNISQFKELVELWEIHISFIKRFKGFDDIFKEPCFPIKDIQSIINGDGKFKTFDIQVHLFFENICKIYAFLQKNPLLLEKLNDNLRKNGAQLINPITNIGQNFLTFLDSNDIADITTKTYSFISDLFKQIEDSNKDSNVTLEQSALKLQNLQKKLQEEEVILKSNSKQLKEVLLKGLADKAEQEIKTLLTISKSLKALNTELIPFITDSTAYNQKKSELQDLINNLNEIIEKKSSILDINDLGKIKKFRAEFLKQQKDLSKFKLEKQPAIVNLMRLLENKLAQICDRMLKNHENYKNTMKYIDLLGTDKSIVEFDDKLIAEISQNFPGTKVLFLDFINSYKLYETNKLALANITKEIGNLKKEQENLTNPSTGPDLVISASRKIIGLTQKINQLLVIQENSTIITANSKNEFDGNKLNATIKSTESFAKQHVDNTQVATSMLSQEIINNQSIARASLRVIRGFGVTENIPQDTFSKPQNTKKSFHLFLTELEKEVTQLGEKVDINTDEMNKYVVKHDFDNSRMNIIHIIKRCTAILKECNRIAQQINDFSNGLNKGITSTKGAHDFSKTTKDTIDDVLNKTKVKCQEFIMPGEFEYSIESIYKEIANLFFNSKPILNDYFDIFKSFLPSKEQNLFQVFQAWLKINNQVIDSKKPLNKELAKDFWIKTRELCNMICIQKFSNFCEIAQICVQDRATLIKYLIERKIIRNTFYENHLHAEAANQIQQFIGTNLEIFNNKGSTGETEYGFLIMHLFGQITKFMVYGNKNKDKESIQYQVTAIINKAGEKMNGIDYDRQENDQLYNNMALVSSYQTVSHLQQMVEPKKVN